MNKIKPEYWVVGILIVAVVLLTKQQPAQVITQPSGGGTSSPSIDLCKLVESEASFTGQRMFLQGTALTTEYVRVMQENGDGTTKDKGQISMSSGTTSTAPGKSYKLYFGENGTSGNTQCIGTCYYVQPVPYTAPCDDATDDKVGTLCKMDTSPTITAFDEYGRPISGSTNAPDFTASETKELTVRVKVSADECYGNSYAPADKLNALCFKYVTNISGFTKIGVDATSVNTPYVVSSSNSTSGYTIDCYGFKMLKDLDYVDITFKPEAHGSFAENNGNNISILVDDIDMDLDADTLAEIWDYEDEDNNQLGVPGGLAIEVDYT